jgi:hypothetical protein
MTVNEADIGIYYQPIKIIIMADYHFFTNPASITGQVAADAFGPISEALYKVDTFVSVQSNAPAYAACDSLVLAQWNDSGKLNLILKPLVSDSLFSGITYFIYKNIDPVSLISSGNIATRTNNDLTELIWSNQEKNDAELGIAGTTPGIKTLGLHFADELSPDYIQNSEEVHMVFGKISTIQLPIIEGGKSIGAFTGGATKAGFEIWIETPNWQKKLADVRKTNTVIDVTSTIASTDAYAIRWAKEEVLSYIDPVAFWGSVASRTGGLKNTGSVINDTTFLTDLGAFTNKSRIYIDLRNENNHSYNLLNEYSDVLLAGTDTNNLASVNYYNSTGNYKWPLLSVNFGAAASSFTLDFGTFLPKIKAVFVSQKSYAEDKPVFYYNETLGEQVSIPLPATSANVSQYRRVMLKASRVELTEILDEPDPSTDFVRKGSFLNSVFPFNKLKPLPLGLQTFLTTRIIPDAVFIYKQDDYNLYGDLYLANLGIAKDGNSVYYFCYPTDKIGFSRNEFEAQSYDLKTASIATDTDFITYFSLGIKGMSNQFCSLEEAPTCVGHVLFYSQDEESTPEVALEYFDCIQVSLAEHVSLTDMIALPANNIQSKYNVFISFDEASTKTRDFENYTFLEQEISLTSLNPQDNAGSLVLEAIHHDTSIITKTLIPKY